MRRATAVAVLGVVGLGGVTAYRIRRAASRPAGRTHVVTVNRPYDEVEANLPAPLTEPDGAVDVELRPAPGNRGTEIHARARDGSVSDDQLRAALRTSRSLLEVGYVLQPGGPTTTPTVFNRALRSVTGRGREKGLL